MEEIIDLEKFLSDDDVAFIDTILAESTSLLSDVSEFIPSTISPPFLDTTLFDTTIEPSLNSSSVIPKKRIYKNRKLEELGRLRNEVKDLQEKLEQIKLTVNTKSIIRDGNGNVNKYGSWEALALRQKTTLQKSISEKNMLLEIVNYQLSTIQTLQQLIYSRMQNNYPSLTMKPAIWRRYDAIRNITPFTERYNKLINYLQKDVEITSNVITKYNLAALNKPQQVVGERKVEHCPNLHFMGATCIFVPASLDLVLKTIWMNYNLPPIDASKNENPLQVAAEGTLSLVKDTPAVSGTITVHRQVLDSTRALVVLQFLGSFTSGTANLHNMKETEWILVEEVIETENPMEKKSTIQEPKTIIRIASHVGFEPIHFDTSHALRQEHANHFLQKYTDSQAQAREQFENKLLEVVRLYKDNKI